MSEKCIKCGEPGDIQIRLHIRKSKGDKPFVSGPRGYCCGTCKDSIRVEDFVQADQWSWQSVSQNVKKRMGFTPRYDATTLGFYNN